MSDNVTIDSVNIIYNMPVVNERIGLLGDVR